MSMIQANHLAKPSGRLARAATLLATAALCACAQDASSPASSPGSEGAWGPTAGSSGPAGAAPMTSSNLNFGGSQDLGFFRQQLDAGQVPTARALDAPGFFAEHHVELPPARCGQRVCLQPMVAVMGNMLDGQSCTMLNLGLNSPIAADPGNRPPLQLSVVVDVSGSMRGDKLAFVKDGLSLLLDGMRDEDRLSLITYSDEASVNVPLSEVGDNRVSLRRAVQNLAASGGTNLLGGLTAGYQELLRDYDPERQNRVILLSDGEPTSGVTDPELIIQESRGYNSDGLGLTTVGLGTSFNIDLMRGLADQADGNFYFLENAGAIDEVFTEELAFFVVPVAFDLQLSLTAGPAYDFGRAYGAPLWENNENGGSLALPSVFVAHRESDEDLTEMNGRRGGGSSLLVELAPRQGARYEEDAVIATVDVSYRDPTQSERQTDTVVLRYPHTPDTLLEQGYFDSDNEAAVRKSFVMLNVYVGLERAVMGFHSGERAALVGDLDSLIGVVEDYNAEADDRDIELDLALLRQLRDNLVANGAPDPRAPVEREFAVD